MKHGKSLKDTALSSRLKVLIVFTLAFMLYLLLTHPLPRNVVTGDVASHYGYVFVISRGIENIGATLYPKLFHLSAAFLSGFLGVSIGSGMYAVTVVSVLVGTYMIYKLSLLLTGHREISLLSMLFSLVIVIYTSANIGLVMPIPQSAALGLLPLVLYTYISRRAALAGFLLGLYMCLHASWPLVFFLLFLYSFIAFLEKRSLSRFRPFPIAITVAMIVYLPYNAFIHSNLIYSLPLASRGVMAGVSIFSFLWLIWPAGVLLLALYASWRILGRRQDHTVNYRFVASSFLLILISSQAYLFGLGTPAFKLVSSENVPLTTERFLTFGLFSISILSAYAVYHLAKGGKNPIIALCLIMMLASLPYYLQKYESSVITLGDSEMGVMDALQNRGDYNRFFLFNPLHERSMHLTRAVLMGGGVLANAEDAFLVFGRGRVFNDVEVSYVVHARDDEEMNKFVEGRRDLLDEIYSNEDYVVYELTGRLERTDRSLGDYLGMYSWYFNNYIASKYASGVFEEPASIRLMNSDTGEVACILFNGSIAAIPCAGGYDLDITATGEAIDYALTPRYGVKPLATKFLWFYDRGEITVSPGEEIDVALVLDNKLHKPFDIALCLYDLDLYVDASADESDVRVRVLREYSGPSYKISSRFFARTLTWVDLGKSYSYANVAFGLPYAVVMEVYDRLNA